MEILPFHLLTRGNERLLNYKINKDEVFKMIVRGQYPELYRNPDINSENYYASYVQTYIERDVTEIINIKDKLKFQNFLRYIASLTGQELIVSQISRALIKKQLSHGHQF